MGRIFGASGRIIRVAGRVSLPVEDIQVHENNTSTEIEIEIRHI